MLATYFSYEELPIWDGSISNTSILVYSEQAIGDTIMFATLLPHIDPSVTVYFIPGKRLLEVYKKYSQLADNIKYVDRDEVKALGPDHFSCQIPVGSLPKLFIDSTSYVPPEQPILSIPPKFASDLRKSIFLSLPKSHR